MPLFEKIPWHVILELHALVWRSSLISHVMVLFQTRAWGSLISHVMVLFQARAWSSLISHVMILFQTRAWSSNITCHGIV
jgi:hypothetical protein